MHVHRIVISAALAVAACKGGGKTATKTPPPTIDAARTAVAVDAAPRGPDAAPPDAARPDARVPGRAIAPGELPEVAGATDGPIELLAADAPGSVLAAMIRPGDLYVVVTGSSTATIRGRARAATPKALYAALSAAFPQAVPATRKPGRGRSPDVTLSFAGAPAVDLFRLFGDVERRNYVYPTDAAKVDIEANRIPSDAVAAAVVATLGRELEVHGNVAYVRKPDAPALDAALIALGGPQVDVDLHDAQAGEAYAALAAAGADVGGAPCSASSTHLDLRLRKVKAGMAAAVIAALGGVAPSPTAAPCTLPDADRTKVTALRGIVSGPKARAAIVDAGTGAARLVGAAPDFGGIGETYVELPAVAGEARFATLYPDPTTRGDPAFAWVSSLGRARLAATLISEERAIALIELPDGTWRTLQKGDRLLAAALDVAIGPGRLSYTIASDDPSIPPVSQELVLRLQ